MISDKVKLPAAQVEHCMNVGILPATNLGQGVENNLHLLINVLLQESCLVCSLWSVLGIVPSEQPFPIVGICQDQFYSKDELQKLELLNNVQDLASLYVVHPCLGSPGCPEID